MIASISIVTLLIFKEAYINLIVSAHSTYIYASIRNFTKMNSVFARLQLDKKYIKRNIASLAKRRGDSFRRETCKVSGFVHIDSVDSVKKIIFFSFMKLKILQRDRSQRFEKVEVSKE